MLSRSCIGFSLLRIILEDREIFQEPFRVLPNIISHVEAASVWNALPCAVVTEPFFFELHICVQIACCYGGHFFEIQKGVSMTPSFQEHSQGDMTTPEFCDVGHSLECAFGRNALLHLIVSV